MMHMKPCPKCGSTNIQYLACQYKVKCKNCGNKVSAQQRYLASGMQPKEASVRSWNESD